MANFVNIDGVNIEDQLLATQDSAGLLSAEDKIKIDNIQPMTIEEIDAICTMDDVTALVFAEYLAEATDSEENILTDNENNTYVIQGGINYDL